VSLILVCYFPLTPARCAEVKRKLEVSVREKECERKRKRAPCSSSPTHTHTNTHTHTLAGATRHLQGHQPVLCTIVTHRPSLTHTCETRREYFLLPSHIVLSRGQFANSGIERCLGHVVSFSLSFSLCLSVPVFLSYFFVAEEVVSSSQLPIFPSH
jgi:hypothetical protein